MSDQVKFKFDKVTQKKVLKGMLYAVVLPAVIAFLQYMGTVDFGNATVTAAIAWLVPVLVNIINEWRKGIPSQ